ncbi:MAG TPA: hypothetical protein VFX96_09040 [Pyrinomonadaceae bacterium]|nr:hypothetical protein [Pyrinomonadaceae bacterium]
MSEKSEILKREGERGPTADEAARREQAREALGRLRRMAETLPSVDAAAVVRESRDASGRDERR